MARRGSASSTSNGSRPRGAGASPFAFRPWAIRWRNFSDWSKTCCPTLTRRGRWFGETCMQTLGLGFTWEQLSLGQRFRTLNRTITETDLVLFTGMTGMLETIFIDRTFAAEKGAIQGQFVPAALTYSLIEGLLCQSMIQGTGLAMLELNKQVLAPVRVGDTVHGEIEITSVRPTSKGNRGIVVSRIDVKNQKDEVVMTYEATRMLAGRPTDQGTPQTA